MAVHKFNLGFIAMAAVALNGFSSETLRAQALDAIFTQESSGAFININTTTGASNTLYTATGYNWNAAAYDPANGLIYVDNIAETSIDPTANITNTIYSFNPRSPSSGVTEVGTITGQHAFSGAGFSNGLYYAIGSGSNQLVSYNLSGYSGSGAIAQNSTQTLGGLGTSVTGLSLGDIEFVGNNIYISGDQVLNAYSLATNYTLYDYNASNTTTPVYAVSEGSELGVGIGEDNGQLLIFNSDGTLETVNPSTGAETSYATITGPALGGGAGDFTIVPEPRDEVIWSLLLVLGLVVLERKLGYRFRFRLA